MSAFKMYGTVYDARETGTSYSGLIELRSGEKSEKPLDERRIVRKTRRIVDERPNTEIFRS